MDLHSEDKVNKALQYFAKGGEPAWCVVYDYDDPSQVRAIKKITSYKDGCFFNNEEYAFFEYAEIIESDEELDNLAVDILAYDMKKRLAEKRAKGRCGWQTCDERTLIDLMNYAFADLKLLDAVNYACFQHALCYDY